MQLNVILVVFGVTLLVLGLLSRILKRVMLSAVLLALLAGVVVGPEGLDLIDPSEAGDERKLMEEVARFTLAIALMGAGLHVTRADLRDCIRPCSILLSAGMVGMWLVAGAGAALLLDLPLWAGLLLGAILTPTDPVVASTLVTGSMAEKNLPRRLRRTLQIESGVNDGLAVPLVLLGVYAVSEAPGTGFGDWALEAGQQVAVALAVGIVAGFVAGRATELVVNRTGIEHPNLIGVGISLALATLGGVHLLGGSGILAVFVAALVFSAILEKNVREQVEEVQEALTKFFVLPAFLVFGMILPWESWSDLGLAALPFVAWILFLRRPPVVMPMLRVGGEDRREAAFLGWFGPIGVAAIFYATLADAHALQDGERIFAAATLAICASVLAHSVTATPGVRAFARRRPLATLRAPLAPDVEKAP